jgi:hypothetical protein
LESDREEALQNWPGQPAPIEMLDAAYNAVTGSEFGAPIVGAFNGQGIRTFASPAEAWEDVLRRIASHREWCNRMWQETGRVVIGDDHA